MSTTWEDVVAFGLTLPEVGESTSYGTPSLKVAAKLMGRLRTEQDGGLALKCTATDKEALVSSENPAFYRTPYYDGHAYVLVNLELAAPTELFEMVEDAWRIAAPAKVRARRES